MNSRQSFFSGFLAILSLAWLVPAQAATVDVQPLNVTRGSSSVAAGGSLSVSWQIRNNGTGTAASSYSQVRITTSNASNGYGSSSNNVGTRQATGSIAAGATISQSTTVTVPTTPGTYYVWVIADNTSVLSQSNTSNDFAVSSAFTATAAANYTVTPSAGTGGTVSPSTAQTVSAGATRSFTVTPNSGYTRNSAVGGTCPQGSWSSNTWTTGAINANCTVSFSFTAVQSTYTVTPSAGTGGTVSPSTAQTVSAGATSSFTVTPNSGYTRNSAVGGTCPQGSWSSNTWTTGAINANCTVSFSFTPTTTTDDHGNSTATATLVAANSSTAGRIEVAGDNDYFRINLTSAGTLTVATTGSTDTYGYLLDSAGNQLQFDDDSAIPNFRISRSVSAGTYYVRVRHYSATSTGAYTLVSTFSGGSTSYTVTPSAGAGGTVSPSTAQTVSAGATTSFTVTPNSGYTRNSAVGGTCPAGSWSSGGSGNTWTTGAISADCAVSFSFYGLLPAPSLSSPSDGATGISITPTFSWASVSGANRYWLTVATTLSALPTNPNVMSCPTCVITGTTGSTSHNLPTAFPYDGTSVTLSPGTTYYWRVQSWNTNGTQGNFSSIRSFTTATQTLTDDHGNSTATATLVAANSSTAGRIEVAGDNDYFRINLTSAGTLTVATTGSTDTYGYLLDSAGNQLQFDDDSAIPNFRISRSVSAGTYYVRVRHYSTTGTGAYTLVSTFQIPAPSQKFTLLLHGMNSAPDTWDSLVAVRWSGRCPVIKGIIEAGDTAQDTNGSYCYRIRFGAQDYQGLTGVEGVNCSDLQNGCKGDFTRIWDSGNRDLGVEVSAAVNAILDRHGSSSEVILLGHSRGGLAARAFLQAPVSSPAKVAVKRLITTGTPHLGSRLGRVYDYLWSECLDLSGQRIHSANQAGRPADVYNACEDDWAAADWLLQDSVLFFDKPPLDLRKPTVRLLADIQALDIAVYGTPKPGGGSALGQSDTVRLNSALSSSASSLPTGKEYIGVVYGGEYLGHLRANVYSVWDHPGGQGFPQFSDRSRNWVLCGSLQSGSYVFPSNCTVREDSSQFLGDGIVPSSSQDFPAGTPSPNRRYPSSGTYTGRYHASSPSETEDTATLNTVLGAAWQ